MYTAISQHPCQALCQIVCQDICGVEAKLCINLYAKLYSKLYAKVSCNLAYQVAHQDECFPSYIASCIYTKLYVCTKVYTKFGMAFIPLSSDKVSVSNTSTTWWNLISLCKFFWKKRKPGKLYIKWSPSIQVLVCHPWCCDQWPTVVTAPIRWSNNRRRQVAEYLHTTLETREGTLYSASLRGNTQCWEKLRF